MYIVAATYIVKEGNEQALEDALRAMIPLAREEPACLVYTVQRAQDNPRKYLLYEVYIDEAGMAAHQATPHFQKYVLGTARPLLESRVAERYETIEA